MEKKFRDLKKGDSVWIIHEFEVVEAIVKKIDYFFDIFIYTDFKPYPFRSPYRGAKRAGNMFLEFGSAFEYLRKRSKKRMRELEKRIEELVSEFDSLDSIQAPTVFPSTKTPSMKELKPGDSVWVVRKDKMEVEKVKITKVVVCYNYIVVDTSLYAFHAFPNSTRSINWLFYTGEEQAWRYMLKWKKSRMCTVGKEMEGLMKELEKYEEVWGSEERR